MKMGKKIKIDWDGIEIAVDMNSLEFQSFLDLETGEVKWTSDLNAFPDDKPDIREEEFEFFPDRFLHIEPVPSYRAFEWMEEYADGVENDAVRGALFESLRKRRPFRRFKDTLDRYDELEKWYEFKEEKIHGYIAELVYELPVGILNPPKWLLENEYYQVNREFGGKREDDDDKAGEKILTWRDICPQCRKYHESGKPPDNHPLTLKSGLTEGVLCDLNRADQEDSGKDFRCDAFEPMHKH